MKKALIFLFILLALLAFSCSKKGVDVVSFTSPESVMSSYNVTSSDIQNYLCGIKGLTPTKAAEVSIEPVINSSDTVMYLVNYENGWELLSGDLRASKVLMMCDTGNCSVEQLFSNPVCGDYLKEVSDAMLFLMNNSQLTIPDDVNDSWINGSRYIIYDSLDVLHSEWVFDGIEYSTLETRTKNHLISTKWGQGPPWNYYMPYKGDSFEEHCYAGCVPVAAGQVLRYLHSKFNLNINVCGSAVCNAFIPDNADYIVLGANDVAFGNYSNNNWSLMATDSSAVTGTNNVSALLLSLGYQYNAKYYRTGTGAITYLATSVFPSNYNINCQYTDTENDFSSAVSIFESNIYTNELPVIMSVVDTTINAGHSIIVDGYKYVKKQVYYRYALRWVDVFGFPVPGFDPLDYRRDPGPIEESYYVAMNWGWNGQWDSISGTPIWHNVFDDWIVGMRHFSRKRYIIHGFSPIIS